MVNRTIKAAAVALAASLALVSGVGPAVADPVSVNDRVGKALVFLLVEFTGQVQVPFNDGAQWSDDVQVAAACTGYIVDPTGFIATAGHCVNTADESLKNELREQVVLDLAKKQNWDKAKAVAVYQRALNESWAIRGGGGDGDAPSVSVKAKQASGPNQAIRDWTTLQVVASQPFKDGDNAVLKLNSSPGPLTALPIAKEAPKTGEAITSVGFPAQVRRVSDDVTLPQPSFKTGTVSSRQQNSSGVAQTEVSATLGKGMSGGPTVNSAGEVIGTNSMKTVSKDETSEFGFVTDNIALRQYLHSHGVTLANPEQESSRRGWWVWLIPLVGIVAVLLVGLLVFALIRKSKSKSGAAGYPTPEPGMPAQFQAGQTPGAPYQGGPQQGVPGTGPSPFGAPPASGPPSGSGPPLASNQSPFMPPPPR